MEGLCGDYVELARLIQECFEFVAPPHEAFLRPRQKDLGLPVDVTARCEDLLVALLSLTGEQWNMLKPLKQAPLVGLVELEKNEPPPAVQWISRQNCRDLFLDPIGNMRL